MTKYIVSTTINPPTEAIDKFCKIALDQDWHLIVVGDLKTPHDAYKDYFSSMYPDRFTYLTPTKQAEKYPELSEAIGWNCIQRRNIGFVEAWKAGAEIIATVDDDNIPMDNWGKDILVGEKKVITRYYHVDSQVFDPIWQEYFWHRGFPIQLKADRRKVKRASNQELKILVQANLWEGEPDVDAVTRIIHSGNLLELLLEYPEYYAADKPAPFNSQNTILCRDIFPTYFLFPYIGRMDDIWAAYITQHYFPNSVVFGEPTVYQKRNEHDLVTDLEQEMFGYRNTIKLVNDMDHWEDYLPLAARQAYRIYKKHFK